MIVPVRLKIIRNASIKIVEKYESFIDNSKISLVQHETNSKTWTKTSCRYGAASKSDPSRLSLSYGLVLQRQRVYPRRVEEYWDHLESSAVQQAEANVAVWPRHCKSRYL